MVPSPVRWVLTRESFCKAGAAAASGTGCARGASDEVIATYDYGPDSGPNNLLLRGKVVDATGLALRTCYAYDYSGRKISETSPRAGLASSVKGGVRTAGGIVIQRRDFSPGPFAAADGGGG